MYAILKREFNAYFASPVGYVYLAMFFLLSGYFFVSSCIMGSTSDMSAYFSALVNFNMFLIPILTMKLMSDEKKQKTDQLLLTSPTKISSIVLGKFFAAFFVYAIGISIALIYTLILSFYVTPAFSVIFGNIFGMLLVGAVLIAAGLFISCLTESQLVSAIVSFALVMALYSIGSFANGISVDFIAKALRWISIFDKFSDFSLGLFNFANIIYYLSFASVFIFLSIRVVEKRRWN